MADEAAAAAAAVLGLRLRARAEFPMEELEGMDTSVPSGIAEEGDDGGEERFLADAERVIGAK